MLLLVVPAALAVETEDFEDETVPATSSSQAWYSTIAQTSININTFAACVDGGQCMLFDDPDHWHVLANTPVTDAAMWMVLTFNGANQFHNVGIYDTAGAGCGVVRFDDDGAGKVRIDSFTAAVATTRATGISLNTPHSFAIDVNAAGYDVWLDNVKIADNIGFANVGCNNSIDELRLQNVGGPADSMYVDNINFGAFTDFPAAPQAPAGLSAVVTDAKTTTSPSDEAIVELIWPVSSDDPDQEQGDFDYLVFLDGVQVATDATTAADGDGLRFHQIAIGGTVIGSATTFTVKARDSGTGLTSVFSCSVNVDTSVLGDQDNCGTGAPSGSGLLHTTDTDTAAGLAGFCSELMGDSEASKFLCGLILVVIVFLGIGAAFAAMAGAPGMPAVIAGSVGAFGMMIFLVVAQIWSLGAAAVIILMATGVALSLMRRLFFGGGGGG